MGNQNNFKVIRKAKIEERNKRLDQFIPKFQDIIRQSGLKPEKIQAITRKDPTALVKMLNQGDITSLQLIAIFGLRAATIGRQMCLITQDYFAFALQKAQECDNIRKSSKKRNWILGQQWNDKIHLDPLFGIPISIKDNIDMEGTVSTIGLTCRAFDVKQRDGCLITCFKSSGAIPFIKTNLPQLGLNFDSQNALWGESLNPWNKKKSCGGSSGGQSGCMAARISVLGIGNDVGGSVRVPATYCGIASLKVSQRRLSYMHTITEYSRGFTGMDSITPVNGPMGTSVDSLALWMKTATNLPHYKGDEDPYTKVIPFDDKEYINYSNKKGFRIGYFTSLSYIQSTPSSQRAVMQTVNFLKSKGHQLIEIAIPDEKQIILSFFTQFSSQGDLKSIKTMLEGQDLSHNYKKLLQVNSLNPIMLFIIKTLLKPFKPRMVELINACQKKTLHQYLLNSGNIKVHKLKWIQFWRQNKLDFLVTPGFGTQATNLGLSNDAMLLFSYTCIWNVLGMTAGSIPITIVREDEQYYNSKYNDDISDAIKSSVKDSAGLPNGIQVIGLPYDEEKVLGLMKQIENHFNFLSKHPFPDL